MGFVQPEPKGVNSTHIHTQTHPDTPRQTQTHTDTHGHTPRQVAVFPASRFNAIWGYVCLKPHTNTLARTHTHTHTHMLTHTALHHHHARKAHTASPPSTRHSRNKKNSWVMRMDTETSTKVRALTAMPAPNMRTG